MTDGTEGPQILEHSFTCPSCWQTITMLVDLSVEEQTYVEDCEVCCRPLVIRARARRGQLVDFEASCE